MTPERTRLTIIALLAIAACTERVVTAVPVATVEVSPPSATVGIGNTVQLDAVPKDDAGHSLNGRGVQWSSSDPSHATVNDGLVLGVAPGTAMITATSQGAHGQATVTVSGVALSVRPDTLAFSAQAGGASPGPSKVRLTSGGVAVDGVTVTTEYSGDATGWLNATLNQTTTPLDVTARATITGLAAGDYAATLSLTAPTAGDTAHVHVSLHVTAAPPPPPPKAPSELKANAVSATEVDLTWKDNSSDETRFELERSADGGTTWTQIATPAADATSYSDTSAQASTSYAYRIRACSDAGCSGYSNQATATTPAPPASPPAAPSELTASAASATQVDLTWKDNSSDETRFELERSADGGTTWAQIAAPAANATSYADTSAQASTSYAYRIRACSDAGCSTYSNQATATTPAPPASPSIALSAASVSLQATAGNIAGSSQVDVTNSGDGTLSGLTVSITYGSGQPDGWLEASLSATTAPAVLTLDATAFNLGEGTYTADVAVASDVASNSPQTVSVTLVVQAAGDAIIVLDSSSVTFQASLSGSSPASKTVQVDNGGSTNLGGLYTVVEYGAGQPTGWLSAALGRGKAPTELTLSVSRSGLLPGTYTATVYVASNGASNSPQTVEVTFTLTTL